jgi:hypothetical protein
MNPKRFSQQLSKILIFVLPPFLLLAGCSDDSTAPPSAPTANSLSPAPSPPAPPGSPAPPPPLGSAPIELPKSLPQMLPGADVDPPAWAGNESEEPFPVKKFFEDRKAPPDNAAPLYFAALADVGVEMTEYIYPRNQWDAKTAQVKSLQDEIQRCGDEDALKSGQISLGDVEHVLSEAQPALAKLDLAQQKKRCIFLTGLREDTLLPHAQAAREFGRLGVLQLYHAQAKNDFPEAEKAVTRTLRFSLDLRPRGGTVCQLVSSAIERMILSGSINFTLGQQGLTPKDCDRLSSVIADHQKAEKAFALEGLRVDYISARSLLDDLQKGKIPIDKYLDDLAAATRGSLVIHREQLQNMNYSIEILALKDSTLALALMVKQPYNQLSPTQFLDVEIPKIKAQGAVLIPMLMETPGLGILRSQARENAMLGGTQCLIAVRRYMLVHGKPPATLAEAVKEAGMSDVPVDPYSGKPMLYTIDSQSGEPLVYSVGPDRVDNHAATDTRGSEGPGDYIFRMGMHR